MTKPGVRAGDEIDVSIEKPVAGGRMIARHHGQVVLVAGAVPGERVRARVERADRRVAFAITTAVTTPSPDRRLAFADPGCGGCVYSHIEYARQLSLKAEIVRDALARIGHIPIEAPIAIAASPESEYRMRARLHVARGRVGFFTEGTHTLCDAASTRQLSDAALDSVSTAAGEAARAGTQVSSIELTENIPGAERALAIAVDDGTALTRGALAQLIGAASLTGCVVQDLRGHRQTVGELSVGDSVADLSMGRGLRGDLRRQPQSFFQANRFLVPALVAHVIDQVRPQGRVLDLYAGVGLFSVSLAAAGRSEITAVEGDRAGGSDLRRNAGPFGAAVTLALESVESFLASVDGQARPGTVIVDPPRTGISSDALSLLIELRAARLVYVSCDPPTLARDARKLLDAGYALSSVEGFDLFPNTPHVECVAVFER